MNAGALSLVTTAEVAKSNVSISPWVVRHGTVWLKAKPHPRALSQSQLLFGEQFQVERSVGGWAYGSCVHDGCRGYIRSKFLSDDIVPPTHSISVLSAPLLPLPLMRTAPMDYMGLGARVAVTAEKDQFFSIYPRGWMYKVHLRAPSNASEDYVDFAVKLVGVPFVWGGRSTFGLDCDGLTQFVLGLSGIVADREADDQANRLGRLVDLNGELPRRGDLFYLRRNSRVFHAGLFVDANTVIHTGRDFAAVGIQPYQRVSGFYQLSGRLRGAEPVSVLVRRLEPLASRSVLPVSCVGLASDVQR